MGLILPRHDNSIANDNTRFSCVEVMAMCKAFHLGAALVGFGTCHAQGQTEDMAALRAFQEGGDLDNDLASWTFTSFPCGEGWDGSDSGWLGVTCECHILNAIRCDGEGGRVHGMYAPSLPNRGTGLTGTLGSLAPLTAMRSLDLSNTAVTGDLADIAGLTGMRFLRLLNTAVTGDIAVLAGMTEAQGSRAGMPAGRGLDSLYLAGTSVHGDAAALRAAIPGLADIPRTVGQRRAQLARLHLMHLPPLRHRHPVRDRHEPNLLEPGDRRRLRRPLQRRRRHADQRSDHPGRVQAGARPADGQLHVLHASAHGRGRPDATGLGRDGGLQ